MAKKKAAKRKRRYLEFGKPEVLQRPPDARPADLVQALAQAALGRGLPAGWKVNQTWRNSPNAQFKSEPVAQMVKKSGRRSGDFVGIYLNRFLRRQADRYGVELKQPRAATAAEIRRDEEIQERMAEREAPEFEGLAKIDREKRLTAAAAGRERKAARSAAAKKGAATRKRNARAAARSAAAVKGWETRKHNARAAARAAKKSASKKKGGK